MGSKICKQEIIERIKYLLDKAEGMDETIREVFFKRIIAEYLALEFAMDLKAA